MDTDTSDNFVVMAHIGKMICEIQDINFQYDMMKAVFEYGTFGEDSSFDNEIEQCLWILIKKTIDDTKSRRRVAQGEAKKRGRPRAKAQEVASENAENAQVDSENSDNAFELPDESADVAALATAAAQDDTPSLDDVYDYCAENALSVNAKEFYTYYEKNGWKTKKGEKITDWRAMCERWNKPIGFTVQDHATAPKREAPTQKKNIDTVQFLRTQWAEIDQMRAKYPKQWAIAINNRRRENPGEFFGLSEGETLRQMKKDGYSL